MVEGLQVTTDKKAAAEQIKGLYRLFVEKDCTMVEVSGRHAGACCRAAGSAWGPRGAARKPACGMARASRA